MNLQDHKQARLPSLTSFQQSSRHWDAVLENGFGYYLLEPWLTTW